jgi:hypothetical protein
VNASQPLSSHFAWSFAEDFLARRAEAVTAASFPGNSYRLVTALAQKGALASESLTYVEAVLLKDWRSWVRPCFEQLRAQLGGTGVRT